MAAQSLSGDFDGDGKSDLAVWAPSTGIWQIQHSSGTLQTQQWGEPGDIPVPADYDGDGKTDLAVWRPRTGTWYVIHSSDGSAHQQQWGQSGDIPAPGDYDGDGKADFAVWRPGNSTWFIMHSSTGATSAQPWGQQGDLPVPGSAGAPAVQSPGPGSQAACAAIVNQATSALAALQAVVSSFRPDLAGADMPQLTIAIAQASAPIVGPGEAMAATLQNLQGKLGSQLGQWQAQGQTIIGQLQSLITAAGNLAASATAPPSGPAAEAPATGSPATTSTGTSTDTAATSTFRRTIVNGGAATSESTPGTLDPDSAAVEAADEAEGEHPTQGMPGESTTQWMPGESTTQGMPGPPGA